jgi:long-chain acyl-CoA synthetase
MDRTLAALWRSATDAQRDAPAYLVRADGQWTAVSWQDAARRVDELAHGLLAQGITRGDRFAILGRTSIEWVLLDWALLSVGAVVVPIYPTSSESESAYILENAEAVGLAVEDRGQCAALEALRSRLPHLRHVVPFDELEGLADRGRAHASTQTDAAESAGLGVREDDIATCIYTSGTTGPPKGCLLRQRNYFDVASRLAELPDFLRPGDRTVLFLPLAHTFGRVVVFAGARVGYTIALCPDVQDLPAALDEVRPQFLPSVPRVYEKMEAGIKSQFDETKGLKRRLVEWALSVGRRASGLQENQRRLSPLLSLQHRLADRLVFSKVKRKLGGELRFGISGAAPLGRETLAFFHALGIPVLEAYGLTECLPVAANVPNRFRLGTVGAPFPGAEVTIAEDGEILARGEPLFQGYQGDPEATRQAIDESGWFHTGDIGQLDDAGFLTITDRKKDLIATSGGKKISPQNLEQLLKQGSRLVSHALIVGDRRPYIVALITLDEAELAEWAKTQGLRGGYEIVSAGPEVRAVVERVVGEVNAELARPEQIKRFAILPRDFSTEEGEITPTLKLKRPVCMQHFEEEVEVLYDGAAGRDVSKQT